MPEILHLALSWQLRHCKRANLDGQMATDLSRSPQKRTPQESDSEPKSLSSRQEHAVRRRKRQDGDQCPREDQIREAPNLCDSRRQVRLLASRIHGLVAQCDCGSAVKSRHAEEATLRS